MSDNKPVIVIKKKGGHGGHHGGAWKIAYADFVTAMMAFFMVMWLVNSADTATKQSVASYFRRPGLFEHGSGTPLLIGEAGILEDAFMPPQKKNADKYMTGETASAAKKRSGVEDRDLDEEVTKISGEIDDLTIIRGERVEHYGTKGVTVNEAGAAGGEHELSGAEERKVKGQEETKTGVKGITQEELGVKGGKMNKDSAEANEKFKMKLAEVLKEKIESIPNLQQLVGLVEVKLDGDGVVIEIADTENTSMFASGSARIKQQAVEAFAKISSVVTKMPNKIEIMGHTDARPFTNRQGGYSNWELSADRANAARRLLEAEGVPTEQIVSVVGRADKELRTPADPFDSSNRRITLKIKFDENDVKELLKNEGLLNEIAPIEDPDITPEEILEGSGDEGSATGSKKSQKGGLDIYRPAKKVTAKEKKDDTVKLPEEGAQKGQKGLIFDDNPVISPRDFFITE